MGERGEGREEGGKGEGTRLRGRGSLARRGPEHRLVNNEENWRVLGVRGKRGEGTKGGPCGERLSGKMEQGGRDLEPRLDKKEEK